VFFERFDTSKILYWLDKGGTSRFFWDPEKVPECYSFRRNPFNIQLISWDLILPDSSFQKMDESEGGKFLDAYYSSVFYCYKDEIKKLILDGSLVLEAGKLHYFGDSYLDSPGDIHFGLFTWKNNRGSWTWAVQQRREFGASVSSMSREGFSIRAKWLREELGYSGLEGKTSFEQALKSFCRMLQRANRHEENRQLDEAYLHFMIALDLVFGLDGKSTESVSRRTAALVYRQRGLASKEQFVRLQKLYKRRSDYVHRGESVSKKELVELDEICQQTLWCLLTVAGKGEISGIDEV
jgi:hypothetical protein